MTMSGYHLSVVIPCHNTGRYLEEAVASVLGQEAHDSKVEVLIVDDHSLDRHTLDVLHKLEASNRGVRILRNTGRSGPATARNLGIAAAQGEWIAFLDSDDVWVPGGLLGRLRVIRSTPDAEWVGGDFVHWFEGRANAQDGYFKSSPVSGPLVRPAYESRQPFRFIKPVQEFLSSPLTWTSTVIVKKSLLDRIGRFDERLTWSEDFHLWIKLAQATDFYFVPMIVAKYRQHGSSLTRAQDDLIYWRDQALRLLLLDPAFKPYWAAIEVNATRHHMDVAYYHLAHGQRWSAMHYAVRATLQRPLWLQTWKTVAYVMFGKIIDQYYRRTDAN